MLLKAGERPSEEDEELYTPLHWAAAKGHVQVARRLIEFGADLDKRGGRFLFTPLHMAAGQGHLNSSRLLIEAGAQVDSFDRFHNSPMHWAAWFGHLSVVRLLVEGVATIRLLTETAIRLGKWRLLEAAGILCSGLTHWKMLHRTVIMWYWVETVCSPALFCTFNRCHLVGLFWRFFVDAMLPLYLTDQLYVTAVLHNSNL